MFRQEFNGLALGPARFSLRGWFDNAQGAKENRGLGPGLILQLDDVDLALSGGQSDLAIA